MNKNFSTLFDLEETGMARFYLGQNALETSSIISNFFKDVDLMQAKNKTISYELKSPSTPASQRIEFDPPSFQDTLNEPQPMYIPPLILGEGLKVGLFTVPEVTVFAFLVIAIGTHVATSGTGTEISAQHITAGGSAGAGSYASPASKTIDITGKKGNDDDDEDRDGRPPWKSPHYDATEELLKLFEYLVIIFEGRMHTISVKRLEQLLDAWYALSPENRRRFTISRLERQQLTRHAGARYDLVIISSGPGNETFYRKKNATPIDFNLITNAREISTIKRCFNKENIAASSFGTASSALSVGSGASSARYGMTISQNFHGLSQEQAIQQHHLLNQQQQQNSQQLLAQNQQQHNHQLALIQNQAQNQAYQPAQQQPFPYGPHQITQTPGALATPQDELQQQPSSIERSNRLSKRRSSNNNHSNIFFDALSALSAIVLVTTLVPHINFGTSRKKKNAQNYNLGTHRGRQDFFDSVTAENGSSGTWNLMPPPTGSSSNLASQPLSVEESSSFQRGSARGFEHARRNYTRQYPAHRNRALKLPSTANLDNIEPENTNTGLDQALILQLLSGLGVFLGKIKRVLDRRNNDQRNNNRRHDDRDD